MSTIDGIYQLQKLPDEKCIPTVLVKSIKSIQWLVFAKFAKKSPVAAVSMASDSFVVAATSAWFVLQTSSMDSLLRHKGCFVC